MRRGIGFGRLEHPHHIAAGDLLELRLGIPAPGKLGEQRRIARNVLHPERADRHPVVVAAQPDVVDAGHLANVVDVIGHLGNRSLGRRVGGFPGAQGRCHRLRLAGKQRLLPRFLGGSLGLPPAHRLADVGRIGIDHDDPAVRLDPREHRVGNVARSPVDHAGARMAEHDGCLRDIERIEHRRLADMGEIDQHPQPLHLADHVLAEIGQAIMRGIVGRAVGPGVVLEVRQRHVARAEGVHLPQHAEAAVDRMAALHAEQRGDPAGLHRLLHIRGGKGKLQPVRIASDQPLHHVDLLDRRHGSLRFGKVRRDIDRPELGPDPALSQPRQVGMHRAGAALAVGFVRGVVEIEPGDHVVAARAQLLGNIVVPVPHRRRLERRGGDFLGRLCRERHSQRQSGKRQDQALHRVSFSVSANAMAAAGARSLAPLIMKAKTSPCSPHARQRLPIRSISRGGYPVGTSLTRFLQRR